MRPVNKGPNPPYTDKNYFKITGDNRIAVAKFVDPMGTTVSHFPIAACLNLWLDKLLNKPLAPIHPPADNDDRNRAVSAIESSMEKMYKLASVPLTTRLGAFCSYCESPMSGLLEVEHCVPKSDYPTFSTDWANFLVCCGPCNTAKSDDPSRVVATPWTGVANPTEQQLYDAIRGGHYTWADLDDEAYDWMPQILQYSTDGVNWHDTYFAKSVDTDAFIVSTDIATRTVIAYIDPTNSGVYANYHVRAVVHSDTGGKNPDNAGETIALCNLNGVSNTASTYDRRMLNRTIAWFNCLKSLNLIKQAQSPEAVTLLWQMADMHSVASGFYSVWLTIIQFVFPLQVGAYVTAINKDGYYPNTNTTELPT